MFHVKHEANNTITGKGLIQVFSINREPSHLSIEAHGGGVWDSGEAGSCFIHRSSARGIISIRTGRNVDRVGYLAAGIDHGGFASGVELKRFYFENSKNTRSNRGRKIFVGIPG